MLSQVIFSCCCTEGLSYEDRLDIGERSLDICPALDLTGRVFITGDDCIAVMEGPTEMLNKYLMALKADDRLALYVPHSETVIAQREFMDYSIWLDIADPANARNGLFTLTPASVKNALPTDLSAKIRIFITSQLFSD